MWNSVRLDNITVCEFRIIHRLVLHYGKPLTYRKVYDVLKNKEGFIAGWGDDGYRTNVRSCIKRIRRKFEKIEPGWDNIVNHMGFGYSWNMD
jgi:two-component system, OmpR family, response regulator ChvI